MKYYAKLKSLNNVLEEEALLSLGEKEIYCFIDSAPYPLIEGNIYLVEINVSFLDEEELSEVSSVNLSFERVGETFPYEIVGFLFGDILITDGVIFRDELFTKEFSFLNSKYVALQPDRISVSFL